MKVQGNCHYRPMMSSPEAAPHQDTPKKVNTTTRDTIMRTNTVRQQVSSTTIIAESRRNKTESPDGIIKVIPITISVKVLVDMNGINVAPFLDQVCLIIDLFTLYPK